MAALRGISFYLPVHGNYSQVEHSAPLVSRAPGSKIFVYGDWNTDAEKMKRFYSTWKGVSVHDFDLRAILEALAAEANKVVFVLTASTNYGFGRAQRAIFQICQDLYPSKVIDVFSLGHCMYGCESCGLSEHNVPLFFTRWAAGELPYSAADVRSRFFPKSPKHRVLVCPTIGDTSYLNNKAVLESLAALAERLKAELGAEIEFVAKLHGFCYLNDAERPHALFTLSETDREGVRFIREHFQLAPEDMPCILPYFEATTIVVTDQNSSVPFEALFFDHQTVIAFHNPETARQDSSYASLLNIFHDTKELEALLRAAIAGNTTAARPVGASGKAFFHAKYGPVDGTEPERISNIRGWQKKIAECKDVPLVPVDEAMKALASRFNEQFPDPSPLDFLARAMPVPREVAEYTIFAGTHKQQLEAAGVPEKLWKVLFNKVRNEVFDAGTLLSFAQLPDEDKAVLVVAREDGIKAESDIFLIDHAWTTSLDNAREQLETLPNLLPRMEEMMGLSGDSKPTAERVDQVWQGMWSYNNHYIVATPDGSMMSLWYVMDEVGTSVTHSDEPSFRCCAFVYAETGAAYSLLWPVRDLEQGDLVTRDFAHGSTHELDRAIRLLPFADRLERTSAFGAPEAPDAEQLRAIYENVQREHAAIAASAPAPISTDFRGAKGTALVGMERLPLKVYTDVHLIPQFLKRPEFATGAQTMEEADVLFLALQDFDSHSLLRKGQFVSQFPNERCVCFKNELAKTVERTLGTPEWFPPTYDLRSQVPKFVAHYKHNEAAGLDNHWIVKPWNLGRSKDIHVTHDLSMILRLAETGPKIVSKYVAKPTLWNGRKFDLRFIVLLRSAEGDKAPECYVYNTFWTRFANKQYALDDFWDYEKHFTVMNYSPFGMTHLRDHEFVRQWDERHSASAGGDGVMWGEVRSRIDSMIGRVFQAAAAAKDGLGMGYGCMAVYGIDLILTEDYHPVLEEINFSPDCTRACDYDDQFYNKVFGAFFLGETEFVTRVL
eukprot:m51a1_g2391 hypothetical protein (1004) ;mRNA; f:727949-731590